MWIADKESEMELRQKLKRYHCWVVWLSFCRIRVRGSFHRSSPILSHAIDFISRSVTVGVSIDLAIGANAAFDFVQGWSDTGWLSVGRNQIVNDVLDEDSFTLGLIERVSINSVIGDRFEASGDDKS